MRRIRRRGRKLGRGRERRKKVEMAKKEKRKIIRKMMTKVATAKKEKRKIIRKMMTRKTKRRWKGRG